MKILLPLAFVLIGCTAPSEQAACNAVRDEGFSNCTVQDSTIWSFRCGKDNHAQYNVQATNPNHQLVNLMVCCSYYSCTVRHAL